MFRIERSLIYPSTLRNVSIQRNDFQCIHNETHCLLLATWIFRSKLHASSSGLEQLTHSQHHRAATRIGCHISSQSIPTMRRGTRERYFRRATASLRFNLRGALWGYLRLARRSGVIFNQTPAECGSSRRWSKREKKRERVQGITNGEQRWKSSDVVSCHSCVLTYENDELTRHWKIERSVRLVYYLQCVTLVVLCAGLNFLYITIKTIYVT